MYGEDVPKPVALVRFGVSELLVTDNPSSFRVRIIPGVWLDLHMRSISKGRIWNELIGMRTDIPRQGDVEKRLDVLLLSSQFRMKTSIKPYR